jgi:phosphoenolpyruvate carboxykinase (GTP)
MEISNDKGVQEMAKAASYQDWVRDVAGITHPADIVWCDGSDREWAELTTLLVDKGALIRLNETKRPNSFLARSHESDVARVEDRTFICSEREEDAGPTNNWAAPAEMKRTLASKFKNSMRGRTMYVVPFSMGPVESPQARFGIEITDSPFVVLNMHLMNRVTREVLAKIDAGADWVPALHSVGSPLLNDDNQQLPDSAWPCNTEKYIVHFPETREIWSYGSGYGGNALLGKKCMSLRIGSVLGRDEGWLAEHMLLMRVTSPEGKNYHLAAAFPSACGKTNLAMLRPSLPGWSVATIGDDIAWISESPNGRLRAINPEAGFFGVAPGTSVKTNAAAIETMRANTIFTNVALTDEGDVWWEGLTDEPPAHLIDWRGNDWTPASATPAAHPNSRFTVSLDQCPTIDAAWNSPDGVELDAILFGGRRATNVPLVVESRDWNHGVFMGATISSEQTAAAEGQIGALRRDPFAMLPFCGYNMADYWQHWIDTGARIEASKRPRIFQVNWFRKDSDGKFLWPGFGENARVIEWIVGRLEGKNEFIEASVGRLPVASELNLDGLGLTEDTVEKLFEVDPESWRQEANLTEDYFAMFGHNLPTEMVRQLDRLKSNLQAELAH